MSGTVFNEEKQRIFAVLHDSPDNSAPEQPGICTLVIKLGVWNMLEDNCSGTNEGEIYGGE